MDIRLEGKTALITGSSLGLGRAMAEKFAAAGANVALVARRPDILEEARLAIAATAEGMIGAYSCDVANKAQIEKTFAQASEELGPIDILVNNAGISRAMPLDPVNLATVEWGLDPWGTPYGLYPTAKGTPLACAWRRGAQGTR